MNSDHPVFACEEQLVAAQLAGNVSALELLLDDALFYVGLAGELSHKRDDLEFHRSGRIRILRMKRLESELADLGSTVVVTVLMDTAAEIDEMPMSKVLRYTRVWTLRGEAWRLVAAHISEVVSR